MTVLHIILTVIQLILAVGLVVIVTVQSGKNSGLSGTIGGTSASESFGYNGAKSKTWDAKFARWTKWVALVFVLLTFVLVLL